MEEAYAILARAVKNYNFKVQNKSSEEPLKNIEKHNEISEWAKEDLGNAINYKIFSIEDAFNPKDTINTNKIELALKNFYNAFYSQEPKVYREIVSKDLEKISGEEAKSLKEIRKIVNLHYSEGMSFIIIIIILLVLMGAAYFKRKDIKNLINKKKNDAES